ncbi:hypothetical protein BC937DRAFT_95222 [Endogone sp. FLAS-F59071]|nr:hypothetical protein BC937DRAFT_95222 [Endogone sp. FLAS-F59071]|eukprot:RUS23359.1 hypothetical protein BC937DRAFT_95222 [Endogone sp. FLAS-F59071]
MATTESINTPTVIQQPPTAATTQLTNGQKDITAKDIANLYSRLQAVIETVREPPRSSTDSPDPGTPHSMSPSISSLESRPLSFSDAKNIPLPASPTVASRRLSSTPDDPHTNLHRSRSSPQADCPCRHILVSVDSKYCSLCDRVIPVVAELQKERLQHIEEAENNQHRLREEARKVMQMTREIEVLHERIEDLEDQLDDRTDQVTKLEKDLESLNEKYVDEIERVAEIQHSKDMVENELEDLSRKLFEEANGMVAHEKREKYDLQVAYQHLQNQLKETQERLAAEEMQLHELRERMGQMVANAGQMESDSEIMGNSRVPNLNDPTVRAIADIALLYGLADVADAMPNGTSASEPSEEAHHYAPHAEIDKPPMSPLPLPTAVDEMMLTEFKEFIATGTTVPLKKIHSIPFMKNCLVEDVETCLRFGPSPRVSARKITDAIVTNTCFIEEAPPGFAEEQYNRPPDVPLKNSASKQHLWERFSGTQSTVIFRGCQACGRVEGHLPFRFRISHFDDWACIDRYCRDRLVAVCEFYVFIRNVRQGYYSNRSAEDLYAESIRLRLQMFYARMGALPSLLRGLGLRHDLIGSATTPTVPPKRSFEGSTRGSNRPSTEIVPEPSSSTRPTSASVTVTPSTSVSSRSSIVLIDPIVKDLPAIPASAHTE